MSKPTRAPERLALLRAGLVERRRAVGPWTPGRGLGVAALGLTAVALVAPALTHANATDGGSASARVAPVASSAATASSATATPRGAGSATSPSAPNGADARTASATAMSQPVAAVPTRASGTTRVLAVPGADSGAAGRTVRYTVEVEEGAGVDEGEYARIVREVLTDRRGWETQDGVHFVNVPPDRATAGDPVDVRITLASPDTVDRMCAPLTTEGQVSCNNGDRVALNSVRWTQGVPYYPDDLLHYRIYLVNHEVGHAIGHDHESCPAPGRAAPVMLQQTLGLQGCTNYPWPVPGQDR